jgi:predicted MFS family arabinose efflux permease
MSQTGKGGGIREALANVRLRKLTLAQFVSLSGDFLAILAVISVVTFRMRGTPGQVSGILIAYMLPQAFVGPAAGVFVDRWNLKRTMIGSDLIRAVLVMGFIFSTNLWEIYATLILLSAVSAFFQPAQSIAIRVIVPQEGLMGANALMMQVFQLTSILSPFLAVPLISKLGEQACFWLDAVSFLFSAGVVSTILLGREAHLPSKGFSSVFSELSAGAKFIMTHATLLFTVLSMAAGMFAVRCYSALIAVYVRDILHAQQALFTSLSALVGLGMVTGTMFVGKLGRTSSKEHMMVAGLFGVAGGIVLLAIFTTTPTTILATIGMGFCVALVVISAQTLMQGITPMNMLGRVMSSMMSVLALAQVAGLTLSGSIAQAIGIRKSYFATSGLVLLIAFAGWKVVEQRKRQVEPAAPVPESAVGA